MGNIKNFEISIVIPAYNESKRLPLTLNTLTREIAKNSFHPYQIREVIVVDDGSKDLTIQVSKCYQETLPGLMIVTSDKNYGKGHAVHDGLKKASSFWILIADADMSTPWTELVKLAKQCEIMNAPIAIGSRDLKESEILIRQSWIREHLGKFFNLMVRSITCLPYMDTQCGFKLIQKDALQFFVDELVENRFAWDVEFLMLARSLGFQIIEVPVRWEHRDESRVHPLRDGTNMAFTIAKLRFVRGLARSKKSKVFVQIPPATLAKPLAQGSTANQKSHQEKSL